MGLRFTNDAHGAIADGTLRVTYRAWKRPQVKVGGKYRIGPTTVQVSSIELVPLADVPAAHRRWVVDTTLLSDR
ncbi:MAG TPA: ASCH domain-containing protein [Acidimicrobiales bacterium]|nr:ASCH domain-containing protein [Acidimicrobiales bacterium]